MMGAAEGVVPVGLLTLAGLFWAPGPRRSERRVTVILALMGAFWALGLADAPTFFYSRLRPFEVLHVVKLLQPPLSASFPSSHASGAAALATVLSPRLGPWRHLAWGLVALSMFGRVYCGVHYPADVLGGLVVGWVAGAFPRYNRDALRPFVGRLLSGLEELL